MSAQTAIEHTYKIELLIPELLTNSEQISEVIEDKNGYLWFTSRKGLHGYDGQKLTTYNNNYEEGNLAISSTGHGYSQCKSIDDIHLWFKELESNKFICFNTQTRKIVKTVDPKRGNGMDHHFQLSQYEEEIFFYASTPTFDQFYTENINKENINAKMDFLATKSNLHYDYFNHEYWVRNQDSIFRYDNVGNIIDTTQGNYFFRTGDEMYDLDEMSIHVWNKQESSLELLFEQSLYFKNRRFIYVKSGKEYWVYSYNRELVLFDPINNTIQDYSEELNELVTQIAPHSLKQTIYQILKLRNGDVLLIFDTVIFKLSPKDLGEEYFKEPIPSGRVITSMRALAEDEAGRIYASFYIGVAVKERGKSFVDFSDTRTGEQRAQTTYSLNIVDENLYWNHNIFNLRTGEKKGLKFDKYGSHSTQLIEQDTLWLYFWNENILAKYVIPSKAYSDINKKLFFHENTEMSAFILNENNANFIVATNFHGIQEIDRLGTLVKEFSQELLGSVIHDSYGPVNCMYQREEELWYGTSHGLGLLNLQDDSVKLFKSYYFAGEDAVQLARAVYFILPAENNNFYLGTSKGLLYFETDTKTFSLLSNDHPLANKEYNRNSAFKASDGRYYVGTVDGLYSFVPADLSFQREFKKVAAPYINHLQIFNDKKNEHRFFINDLNNGEKINLRPSDFNVKVDFSSLMFDDEVYYSYRVRGLSDIWSPYSSNSELELFSIPPGDYTLEIKSTQDLLFEQDNITRLHISKSKIWYARSWVIGLFVIGLMAIAYFFSRFRYQLKLNRQIEMENLRTKISSDLHDDVGSILTGVAMQSEMMGYSAEEDQKKSFRALSEMSRDAMEKMRDTVWAIDARKDKFQDLISKMHNFAEQQLNIKNIKYRLEVEGINKEKTISPLIRQSIYLIFKEAITNVVKHSSATEVHILVSQKNNALLVKVYDNGRSINKGSMAELPNSGLGLSNMKMRAERIGGKLSIENDNGFAVMFRLQV